MSDSLWPHGLHYARLLCPPLTPWVCSNSCPLSQWCYLTISSSVTPSPFADNLSQHQGLFQWVGSSHQVAKVLELQHQSFQWMHWWIKIRVLCLQWICSRVESMNKWVNKKIILRGKGKPGSASKVPQGRWNPPLEKVLITALYKDIVRCGFPVRDPVETRESAQM